MPTKKGLKLETPARYEIRVQGFLDSTWSDRMNDAKIRVERTPDDTPDDTLVTVLTAEFMDQAALAGALGLLYDLGFPLLSVQCLAESADL